MLFETETNGKPDSLLIPVGIIFQTSGIYRNRELYILGLDSPSLIQRVRPAHAQKLDTDEATGSVWDEQHRFRVLGNMLIQMQRTKKR
jgi:hypothetical protein